MIKGHYAGIGSRSTPGNVCDVMTKIAWKLSDKGWVLRSGGARGADDAFYRGCVYSEQWACPPAVTPPKPEIYMPTTETSTIGAGMYGYIPVFVEENLEMIHRAWKICAFDLALTAFRGCKFKGIEGLTFSQKCHIRNVFQVMGLDLDTLVKGLICYAPWQVTGQTNSVIGGTNTAYRIAKLMIPSDKIYNLYDFDTFIHFMKYVKDYRNEQENQKGD